MRPKVGLESTAVVECLRTDGARVRSLAHVDAHVSVEAAHVREVLVTRQAAVRFLAGVDPHVLLEVADVLEALLAIGTWIWLNTKHHHVL